MQREHCALLSRDLFNRSRTESIEGYVFPAKRSRLGRSQFVLRSALKPQSPQLLSANANSLDGIIIVGGCLWSIRFLIFARFEQPLCAGTIGVFMLGHELTTPPAKESSPGEKGAIRAVQWGPRMSSPLSPGNVFRSPRIGHVEAYKGRLTFSCISFAREADLVAPR